MVVFFKLLGFFCEGEPPKTFPSCTIFCKIVPPRVSLESESQPEYGVRVCRSARLVFIISVVWGGVIHTQHLFTAEISRSFLYSVSWLQPNF